jgi:hypothetical protein
VQSSNERICVVVIATCASATRPEEIQKVELHPSVLARERACRDADKSNLFLYIFLSHHYFASWPSLRINKNHNLKSKMPISLFVKSSTLPNAAHACSKVLPKIKRSVTRVARRVRNTTLRQILFFKCATTVKHWFRLWLRAC